MTILVLDSETTNIDSARLNIACRWKRLIVRFNAA